jgi:site-specific recombinase XerD
LNFQSTVLRDVFETFRVFRQAEGLSPRTIEWYEHIMNTLMRSPQGVKPTTKIEKITDHELYRHIGSLSTGGHGGMNLQASSVNGHARALRAFFNWAYRERYTETQLLANFKPPRPDEKEVEVLTDAEIARLIIITKSNPRDLAIITTLLDTGLRKSELVNAKIGNIDFDQGTLKVRGKGRKERLVLLGIQTRKQLLKYLRTENGHRLPGVEEIFITNRGTAFTGNGVTMLFNRMRKNSGIERLHPHLLRHTFATRYLQSGGNALALKQLLGHTSLKMVDRYVHFASMEAIRASSGLSLLDRIAAGQPISNQMPPVNSKQSVVTWSGGLPYDDRD